MHFIFFALTQALFDLEATNAELKGDLRDLWIAGAQVGAGRWHASHFGMLGRLFIPTGMHGSTSRAAMQM